MVLGADERALRRLAELLAPYLPAPATSPEPDRWMSTREAAEYAGTSTQALHKRDGGARDRTSSRTCRGGKAWFKRADIDAWRRGERPG